MFTVAVAVRDANDFFLEASVVRTDASDVYLNFRRDHDPTWRPHASYHASCQFHHKSFGTKLGDIKKGQKPDPQFTGTVNLASFGLAEGEHKILNRKCNPAEISAVFGIPASMLHPRKYGTYVYTDLVEPDVQPVLYPNATILLQSVFKDAEPWIVLTFLQVP